MAEHTGSRSRSCSQPRQKGLERLERTGRPGGTAAGEAPTLLRLKGLRVPKNPGPRTSNANNAPPLPESRAAGRAGTCRGATDPAEGGGQAPRPRSRCGRAAEAQLTD